MLRQDRTDREEKTTDMRTGGVTTRKDNNNRFIVK